MNFCPNVVITRFGKLESSVKQKINFLWSLCNSNENLRPPDMHYKYEQGEIFCLLRDKVSILHPTKSIFYDERKVLDIGC